MMRASPWFDLLAILGGVFITLSLAPFDYWPLALAAPALLFVATESTSLKRGLLRFYLFNIAMFGSGVFWIHVSVDVYGGAPLWLAISLVVLLILSYSLLCLPLAWLYLQFFRSGKLWSAIAFCGFWVMQEWVRSWILTGFPWLFLGYGVMETPLQGIAPVTGIFGLSLVVCLISVSTLVFVRQRQWLRLVLPLFLAVVASGAGLYEFTALKRKISVSLVQGNIDQHVKWRASSRLPILNHYLTATSSEWGRDLIVWPEAALTIFREQAGKILADLGARAREQGSTVVLGIPDRDDEGGFQNSVVAVGLGEGQYIKRRLVPFGEYVPLESLIRGVIQLFDLPMSHNKPGPWEQAPLSAGNVTLSTSICYEVVYPDLVRSTVNAPDLLVTVSNDTWFGESIGPWQHLQMARMRALENGRSMARATNNGITVLIDHRGRIVSALPRFEAGILRGQLEIRSGLTPFHRFGSYPVLLLSLGLILIGLPGLREKAGFRS